MRRAALVLSLALLPLFYNPLRFEGHETLRAGFLLVLVIAALPALRPHFSHDAWPVLLAAGLWALSQMASTGFALSPVRALAGDSVRRMGLLTQFALLSGLLFGAMPRMGRWLWIAGLSVSAYVLLQSMGLISTGINPLRPTGPLGASVFTAGWLALACLWVALGADLPLWKRLGGAAVMAFALIITGSRGAALALLAGGIMAALAWAAAYRARRVALAAGVLSVCVLAGVFLLRGVQWQGSLFESLPLISRLNPGGQDSTQLFRARVWGDALALGREWPLLSDIHNIPDRFAPLRPLIGYGLESFETLERLRSDSALRQLDSRPVDRAHNDWLDTLLTSGWLGALARAALWCGAWVVALRRMRLWGWGAWLLPGLGSATAGFAVSQSVYLPVAITFGALIGGGVWLFWLAFRPSNAVSIVEIDRAAWIGLVVVVAHIVDLQFSFTTVATGWLLWLALGMLAAQPNTTGCENASERERAIWYALAGAALLRALLVENASLLAIVLLMLALAALAQPLFLRRWVYVLFGLSYGLMGALLTTPESAALWDILLVVTALLLMLERLWPLKARAWRYAVVLTLALGLWWLEDSASIGYRQGITPHATDILQRLEAAAARAPWDDRIIGAAGDAAFNHAQTTEAPNSAKRLFDTAAAINAYDALLAWRLASVYATFDPPDVDRAKAYFDTALRLWPGSDDLVRARATFLANLARGTNP